MKLSPVDIFVHVPKTAGLSLRNAVIEHHGSKQVYVYDMSSQKLLRSDRQLLRRERPAHIAIANAIGYLPPQLTHSILKARGALATSPEVAFRKGDAIVGHFVVNTFEGVAADREVRQMTVVRDPLARMVSHYRYLQQQKHFDPSLRGWQTGQDPDLPFSEFALSDNVRNFQASYTGTDPSRFAILGTMEDFPKFLLNAGLITDDHEIPRVNVTTSALLEDPTLHDAGFVRDFQSFHDADYAFYAAADERSVLVGQSSAPLSSSVY